MTQDEFEEKINEYLTIISNFQNPFDFDFTVDKHCRISIMFNPNGSGEILCYYKHHVSSFYTFYKSSQMPVFYDEDERFDLDVVYHYLTVKGDKCQLYLNKLKQQLILQV